ncbi:MAG: hypothetical protein KGZ64_05060 [Thermaerobacter sp.]|nr:hypothetical protein [Thermaerobacter sp.]
MKEVSKALLEGKIRDLLLENVMATPWHDALRQGLVYVHSLTPDFRSLLFVPEFRTLQAKDEASYILGLVHAGKLASWQAAELALPHFVTDIGLPCLQLYGPKRLAAVFRQLFALWSLPPQSTISLNLGDDLDRDSLVVMETVLDVLDQGATFLEPQVIMRVRRGVNLERESGGYKILHKALAMARSRAGMAFALMDSPRNSSFMGLMAFSKYGLRLEPARLDFYQGTRGQTIGGQVSLNLSKTLIHGVSGLKENLAIAARILATNLELTAREGGLVKMGDTPLIINLGGLHYYPVSHELFDMLGLISEQVASLRREFDLNIMLAATGEDVPFASGDDRGVSKHKISALVASMEQYLPAGHCLRLPAGLHLSIEDLYEQLCEAIDKGISFLRFIIEDVRCSHCHLAVRALGPCPQCGSESRRQVVDRGG